VPDRDTGRSGAGGSAAHAQRFSRSLERGIEAEVLGLLVSHVQLVQVMAWIIAVEVPESSAMRLMSSPASTRSEMCPRRRTAPAATSPALVVM
jgi:hypothetical protein